MCTNKKWIYNPYNHKRILVSCGHCPSCLQQKALHRVNRIDNNKCSDGSQLPLFVTLTYSNDFVPYVRLSDIKSAERYKLDHDDNVFFYDVPVYRDKTSRFYKGVKSVSFSSSIDTVTLDDQFKPINLKPLKGKFSDCIGICYYKDVQNFIKRLRINLLRNGFQNNFSFYSCSEYGPTTSRPHFHLLIWSSEKDLSMWKSAISKAWPFDAGHASYNNVEIARKASSYVASYVNCSSSLPLFLRQNALRPSHSYSKGFGANKDVFSLSSLLSKIESRDLHYFGERIEKGVRTNVSLLFPKYIINRYFPKFLGCSRLNDYQIRRICLSPSTFREYSYRTGADYEQQRRVVVSLNNAFLRFHQLTNLGRYDYSRYFTDVWNLYQSSLLGDLYSNINDVQSNFYAYDNIKMYYDGMVKSASLDSILSYHEMSMPSDPNLFPNEVRVSNNLSSAFSSYSKDRKVRNLVYSNYQNV